MTLRLSVKYGTCKLLFVMSQSICIAYSLAYMKYSSVFYICLLIILYHLKIIVRVDVIIE